MIVSPAGFLLVSAVPSGGWIWILFRISQTQEDPLLADSRHYCIIQYFLSGNHSADDPVCRGRGRTRTGHYASQMPWAFRS